MRSPKPSRTPHKKRASHDARRARSKERKPSAAPRDKTRDPSSCLELAIGYRDTLSGDGWGFVLDVAVRLLTPKRERRYVDDPAQRRKKDLGLALVECELSA